LNAADQRLTWAVAACRTAQMRLTPLRQAMLAFLATQRMPVSLEMIARADGIRGQCDATTVYRTQALFKAADIVRQVGTPGKVNLFLLNVPEETRQFLICRRCGCIKEIALPRQVVEAMREVATLHGFASPWQDYEVYGLCPACAIATRHQIPPSKLPLCRAPARQSPPRPPGSAGAT
jgi:Fur family transcriptional regulator, ferric uptake regulator